MKRAHELRNEMENMSAALKRAWAESKGNELSRIFGDYVAGFCENALENGRTLYICEYDGEFGIWDNVLGNIANTVDKQQCKNQGLNNDEITVIINDIFQYGTKKKVSRNAA